MSPPHNQEPRPAIPLLRSVEPQKLTEAERALTALLPALKHAEIAVALLRSLIDDDARALAKERGVAFIRHEQIRAEFGGDNGR